MLESRMGRGKALLLLGPRQTGKTTLVRELLKNTEGPTVFHNADDPAVRRLFDEPTLERLRQIVGAAKTIVIDEAQRIQNIGLALKMIVDEIPHCQAVATGSSALDLASAIAEPLTGRKFEFHLFPISWQEWSDSVGFVTAHSGLENRLLFGMYPEVVTSVGHEKEALAQLASSYLYKDILAMGNIRKPDLLEKLLQALALQVGSEVSLNELGNMLRIDKNTVSSYLDLLEKSFVIFRLGPLSRNLRNEITTGRKIYFYDNGIRNALIGNFNPLALRSDTGALWENFIISERMKRNHYAENWFVQRFFWRAVAGAEIDYIEQRDGKLFAYELKWGSKNRPRQPKTFANNYPDASFEVITPDNFTDFLTI